MKGSKRKAKPAPNPRPDFKRLPLEPIPDTWTYEQVVAVHDFCVVLQEIIWRRYPDALTDAALNLQRAAQPPSADDRTYRLPFDDEELPF